MRYRKLSEDGDYVFGNSAADFHRNNPEAVGQAIRTRLLLYAGEWFLDTKYGMQWGGFPINDDVVNQGRVLGKKNIQYRDLAIKTCVLNTQGVKSISDYSSILDANTRILNVSMVVDTIYGVVKVDAAEQSGRILTADVDAMDSQIGLG